MSFKLGLVFRHACCIPGIFSSLWSMLEEMFWKADSQVSLRAACWEVTEVLGKDVCELVKQFLHPSFHLLGCAH